MRWLRSGPPVGGRRSLTFVLRSLSGVRRVGHESGYTEFRVVRASWRRRRPPRRARSPSPGSGVGCAAATSLAREGLRDPVDLVGHLRMSRAGSRSSTDQQAHVGRHAVDLHVPRKAEQVRGPRPAQAPSAQPRSAFCRRAALDLAAVTRGGVPPAPLASGWKPYAARCRSRPRGLAFGLGVEIPTEVLSWSPRLCALMGAPSRSWLGQGAGRIRKRGISVDHGHLGRNRLRPLSDAGPKSYAVHPYAAKHVIRGAVSTLLRSKAGSFCACCTWPVVRRLGLTQGGPT
jgi:hypothetical protein